MIIFKNGEATFKENEPVKLSKLEQKKVDLKKSAEQKRQARINKANQKREDYKNGNS